MRSVEVEGGSIDEAIERALEALGAARDQVEIDILENAARGLLGIGRRRARVRATMRVPFGFSTGDGAPDLGQEGRARPATPAGPEPTSPPPLSARATQEGKVAAAGEPPEHHAHERSASTEPFDGAAILGEILRRMGFAAHVRAATDAPGGRTLQIESTDPAAVAACRGEVLAALELLLNRIAERHAKEKTRFSIVLAGARARSDVQALARRLAQRVRARGKPITIDARAEDERRALIEALRDERGVRVRTSGGAQRNIIIIPWERRRGGGTTDC